MFAGRKFLLAAVMAAAVSPLTARAQEAAPAAPAVNNGKVSFALGADWTTHYYFRGIPQENQGVIFQPYGEVGFALYEGEGAISSVGLALGTWHSFHSGPTADNSPDDPSSWYEADVYVSLSIGLFENFELGTTYTLYTSPNDSFNEIADIALSLAYDDSGLWGDSGFALNPYVTVVFEVDDEADGGNSAFGATGTSEGTYLEIGIEPSFTIVESETMPITLAIPAKVGLSIDDYYEVDGANLSDETFGFASVGFVFSTPLAFIPADYGAWSLSAGATLVYISDEMEQFAAGIGVDQFEVIGTIGISMEY